MRNTRLAVMHALPTKLPLRYCFFGRQAALDAAGCHQRALRLVGVDIDKADMHAGKGSPALHADGVVNDARAVGQMAAVPAGKGAENLDVLDRVIIAVTERERNQGPNPSPPLRQDCDEILSPSTGAACSGVIASAVAGLDADSFGAASEAGDGTGSVAAAGPAGSLSAGLLA